jgi:hypothetical protein
LVKEGEYELHYSHWCAHTLPEDFFWGPEHAEALIRVQPLVDDSGWLDDVGAEGGVVLDFDRKNLLLFGGEEVLDDVPLRRVYLELLERAWRQWTVRWAYEGIADLADYVGYPRQQVLYEGGNDWVIVRLTPPARREMTRVVASLRLEDGSIRLYPLMLNVVHYLGVGSKLATDIRKVEGMRRLFLDEWRTRLPVGGFHLDLVTRGLDYWVAGRAADIENRVSRAWPGFETCWHRDRYEMQLERTEGLLRFAVPDHRTLLDRCREMLLQDRGTSPVGLVRKLVEDARKQHKDVHVQPVAFRDDRVELSKERRIAIVNAAMAEM